ncbi:phytolongin Phyl2.2 [Rhodamnia argentea]|uniref:Phytolongin Phyl2.2 n=1 Tax=Rhodamnia argentea TaxID=178133 RepID=A0A8B8QPG9_9MYRT|nr:phytolongin Phyl2.2 [Rhodamnia argentea]
MIPPNPNHIFFVCIARGASPILAEFSGDPDLRPLAHQCLLRAPPHHSSFSHTVRGRSYTFLIADPLAYFAVSDDSLERPEVLRFLDRLRSSFEEAVGREVTRCPDDLRSYCFQSQFDEILRELMRPGGGVFHSWPGSITTSAESSRNASLDGGGAFMAPLLGSPGKGLKKKKRLNSESAADGDAKDSNFENKVDVGDHANGSCRDFPASMQKSCVHSGERQRAKQVWKKHVWVVLSIDLLVCVVLFGVWLWVCRGFQCIDG